MFENESVGNRPGGPVLHESQRPLHMARLGTPSLQLMQSAALLPALPDFTNMTKDQVVAAYNDLYNQSMSLSMSYLNLLGMIRDKDISSVSSTRQQALESVILTLADLIKNYTPGLQSSGLIEAVNLINTIMPGAISR